jgi:hypothetical protein
MNYIALTIFISAIGISFPIYANETQSAAPEKPEVANNNSYVPGMGVQHKCATQNSGMPVLQKIGSWRTTNWMKSKKVSKTQ